MQQPPLPTTTTNMATGASPLRYALAQSGHARAAYALLRVTPTG